MRLRNDAVPSPVSAFGGERGMKDFVERYYGRVYNLCFSFVRDRDEACDLAQDVFVKLLDRMESFRGEADLSTWIYRIGVNTCIDSLRKRKRRAAEPFDERYHDVAGADDFTHKSAVSDMVRGALMDLPVKYRTVVILREFEGRSYREIADVLECSVGTVESRLFRARELLKRILHPIIRGEVDHEV
ncbi:MAG TPA: sigma-70 family RNA polymerase sigma factor [Spirochaetota bacterium]|nr:sigma-70 family RNA polymerase sigma factor [Spirochaetota bacterium]